MTVHRLKPAYIKANDSHKVDASNNNQVPTLNPIPKEDQRIHSGRRVRSPDLFKQAIFDSIFGRGVI